MAGVILHMDNIVMVLERWGRLLEQNGYQIISTQSLEDARQVLQNQRVHLAILDIRMEDEQSGDDDSGIRFAEEFAGDGVPKIFLTNFDDFDYVYRTLSLVKLGHPLELKLKREGHEPFLKAVRNAFEKQIGIDWELKIDWAPGSPRSFVALLGQCVPNMELTWLADRALELEDLFRKVFAGQQSLVIQKTLWMTNTYGLLQVQTHNQDGISNWVVVCQAGSGNTQIQNLPISGYMQVKYAKTPRFSASAGQIDSTAEELGSLLDYFERESPKQIERWINQLFQKNLLPIFRPSQQKSAEDPSSFYLDRRAHFECENSAELATKLIMLVERAREMRILSRRQLIEFQQRVQKVPNWLVKSGGLAQTLPFCRSLPELETGNVLIHSPNVFPGNQQAGLDAPILHLFVSLEVSMRLTTIPPVSLINALAFEKALLKISGLKSKALLSDVEPEYDKLAYLIQAIRQNAGKLTGVDLSLYWYCLNCQVIEALCQFLPERIYSTRDVWVYLHLLSLSDLLIDALQELQTQTKPADVQPTYPAIQLLDQAILRGDDRIELTEREAELLSYLYQHVGKVCSRKDIMHQAYGISNPSHSDMYDTLDTYLGRLRGKLEPEPPNWIYLITVRRKGLMLIPNPENTSPEA